MKMLIAIISCRKPRYQARTKACIDTWGQFFIDDPRYDLITVVGDEDLTEDFAFDDANNILTLKVRDGYPLARKMKKFCEYLALSSTYDFMLKCDDDTYLTDRVKNLQLDGIDFLGGHIPKRVDWKSISGGSGYILSRKAYTVVAKAADQLQRNHEDMLVSNTLSQHGVDATYDKTFVSFPMTWNGKQWRQDDILPEPGTEKRRRIATATTVHLHRWDVEAIHRFHKDYLAGRFNET